MEQLAKQASQYFKKAEVLEAHADTKKISRQGPQNEWPSY